MCLRFFVISVSGDIVGPLQAGQHHLHGPGIRQGGQLCEGNTALYCSRYLKSNLHKLGSRPYFTINSTVEQNWRSQYVPNCLEKRELWDSFILQHMLKSFSAFRLNPLRRIDSPRNGFQSRTCWTTSFRNVGSNSLRKETSGKEISV